MRTINASIDGLSEENKVSSKILPFIPKHNKAFHLFRKVQKAMQHVPDFVETCKAILDAVMDELDAEKCSVMLKDEISGELCVLVSKGRNDGESGYSPDSTVKVNRFKLKEGIAGWVLREGRAVMVNDVKEEARFVTAAGLNNDVRSLICFPLREKERVVGIFNLSHSKQGAFDERDKLFLAYISNQVGAALTSARFFTDIEEMSRLPQDFGESSTHEKRLIADVPPSSTLIEVGEMMARKNGIFIYTSGKMHRIKEIIDQVANTDVTVLIQGESGVGKEVVARSIHLNSFRRERPFVKVNCAALPQELLESELFGYERGAFTGAYRQKPGKFELANGGTIFLDEIVEMSLPLQAKLLQVLQDREFSRLGSKKDTKVDVRVLAATNKNIDEAVSEGRFREDLYYRLNVVNITIPPLRERKEEIPIFVEYFLDKFAKKYNKVVKPLSPQMIMAFIDHHWMGNVRELENMIQRFVVLGDKEVILNNLTCSIEKEPAKIIGEKNQNNDRGWLPLKEVHRKAIIKAETEVIRRALELTNWNRKKAANVLNISYKTLLYKIKESGLDKQPTSLWPQ